mgnify:CR=1 FL=1
MSITTGWFYLDDGKEEYKFIYIPRDSEVSLIDMYSDPGEPDIIKKWKGVSFDEMEEFIEFCEEKLEDYD